MLGKVGCSYDGSLVGKKIKFERVRRITGYLVGTLDRFNDAKRAEEADRIKHCTVTTGKLSSYKQKCC